MKSSKLLRRGFGVFFVILISAVIVFVSFSVTYTIDHQRIRENHTPFFVYYKSDINDGGTIVFFGFGYHIVKWHRLIENSDYETGNGDYVCGWDIHNGYDVSNTLSLGPQSERTYNFHFE